MTVLSRLPAAAALAVRTVAICILAGLLSPAKAAEDDALWEALRTGEAFGIMRHALAPGTGDPAHVSVDDCATQRNLSEEGRRQAARIGDRFRAHGIERAFVFSSAWCRCLDTAELLHLGPVTTLPPLNSFFATPSRRDPQTAALMAWLADNSARTPLVLVTHQVNIRALTGTHTRSGEMVVARAEGDGSVTVVGKIATQVP